MFVRDGAVTPGPSRECDITFFVKGRPKSARQSRDSTVAARRVQSVTIPSSRVCRSPGLRPPPLFIKNARKFSVTNFKCYAGGIFASHSFLRDGPNKVSESTVSNTELSEIFGPHRVPGRELSEFLSAYYLCAKANSPSLPQNSVRLSEFSSPKQYS